MVKEYKKEGIEPLPDIGRCGECGWEGKLDKCEIGVDEEWESGRREEFYYCPICEDGGCIDNYEMSAERVEEWYKWNLLKLRK